MAPLPHYLRFARAAALLTSAAVTPGCYAAHLRPGDAPDAATPDVGVPDAARPDAPLADAWVDPCTTCTCSFRGGTDTCESRGLWMCCPVVGPLSPPDLPA